MSSRFRKMFGAMFVSGLVFTYFPNFDQQLRERLVLWSLRGETCFSSARLGVMK